MSLDYEQEQKKLEAFIPGDATFWKPKPGQHKVKALTELEEAEPYDDNPQMKLQISVGGEEKTWSFSQGISPVSTYGQLVALATRHANALTNVEFTVVVVSDGKKNSYTIVD